MKIDEGMGDRLVVLTCILAALTVLVLTMLGGALAVAFFLGTFFGVFALALCQMGKSDDPR